MAEERAEDQDDRVGELGAAEPGVGVGVRSMSESGQRASLYVDAVAGARLAGLKAVCSSSSGRLSHGSNGNPAPTCPFLT